MPDAAITEPSTSAGKKWYVVHTYSGFEQKAKAALEERVRSLRQHDDTRAIGDKFGDVVVPLERVQELGKGGQRKVSNRKFFPGYIFVNMELDDETWHVVKDTPKVTGFVGHSTSPPEVPASEVRGDQAADGRGRVASPNRRCCLRWARRSKWLTGPFQDFNGTVEEVRPDKGKVRVLISIFGRATPVELDFVQVEKS